MSHPDGLERAKQCMKDQLGMLCIFCEDPVENGPAGRHRLICKKRCCFLAYHRAYHRDYRIEMLREYPLTKTYRRICKLLESIERSCTRRAA